MLLMAMIEKMKMIDPPDPILWMSCPGTTLATRLASESGERDRRTRATLLPRWLTPPGLMCQSKLTIWFGKREQTFHTCLKKMINDRTLVDWLMVLILLPLLCCSVEPVDEDARPEGDRESHE